MKMKINSKAFRVREGDNVDLKKWPTKVDPVLAVTEFRGRCSTRRIAQHKPRAEFDARLGARPKRATSRVRSQAKATPLAPRRIS
jgi:hypothetical protein